MKIPIVYYTSSQRVETEIDLVIWEIESDNLRELHKGVLRELAYRFPSEFTRPNDKPKPEPVPTFVPMAAGEKALIEAGLMIAAIKAFRTRTGKSLRESKDACDAYAQRPGVVKAPSDRCPQSDPGL